MVKLGSSRDELVGSACWRWLRFWRWRLAVEAVTASSKWLTFPRRRRRLRDQVAAIYNRVGNVKNGERVEDLEREKRFARVRTASGLEGWIEQRYLVDQKTFDGLQKLTQDNQNDPVQAPGVLRNETNLHITPGRETEHLYQLASGAKVAILKRATAEKQSGAAPRAKPIATKPGAQGCGRSGA